VALTSLMCPVEEGSLEQVCAGACVLQIVVVLQYNTAGSVVVCNDYCLLFKLPYIRIPPQRKTARATMNDGHWPHTDGLV